MYALISIYLYMSVYAPICMYISVAHHLPYNASTAEDVPPAYPAIIPDILHIHASRWWATSMSVFRQRQLIEDSMEDSWELGARSLYIDAALPSLYDVRYARHLCSRS